MAEIQKQKIIIDDREYNFLVAIGPVKEEMLRLEYDNINNLIIGNDVENGTPKLQIQYTDINFQTVSKIEANGKTFIAIDISCPQVTIERGKQLVSAFIIDDIQVMSVENNQATYLITATHSDGVILSNYIDFSVSDENPIDILMKVFKKAGLSIVNKQPLPDVKCNHIAGSSDTLNDQCLYLCNMASSTKAGSYFVVYNFFLNKWTIVSTANTENTNYQTEDVETFVIPTINDGADKASIVTNLKQIKVREKSESGIPSYNIKRYDHIKRSWDTKQILNKMFKSNINHTGKFTKPTLSSESDERRRTIYLPTDSDVGRIARNLILYTDAIEFTTMGNLRKEVGGYININSSSVELSKKFGGVWMIAKIDHVINKTGYRCNIVAVRATNLKYENSKKAGDA